MPRENCPKENKESLPVLIVDDGKYVKHNLTLTKTDQNYFDAILKEQNIPSVKKVFVLTLDGSGKVYLQCKGEKFRTFRICLPEGSSW